NFGMVRLLSKEQAIKWAKLDTHLKDTRYYLEITHHPSIKNLHIERDMRGQPRPSLGTRSSLLPLDETHMRSLFQHLYTVRFVVQGERAYPYGYPKAFLQSPFLPTLSGVPDGTYEFYEGKAYKISFQGWSFALPDDHPLYQATPERIQLLFNLGMEFDTRFSPKSSSSPFQPMRYVYFRHGDLYLMGAPLFFQGDADLLQFQEQEKAKQAKDPLYPPFLDQGPPLLADGTLDLELLHKAGLVVPERHYFMLGDNHAVSADSRDFGFVPEENLKGAPDFVFWPPGSRFGPPNQPPYPWFVPSRIIIWVLAFSSIGGALYWQRKRQHVPPL
ncbi:MAG: signal peptidase I, partial [Chlamydiae bacterium]|nr:signal peptidase I [Chlamydiota bacterium]